MQMSVRIRRHSASHSRVCRDDGRIGQHCRVPAETGRKASLLALNTPLVNTAAGFVVGHIAERLGPLRWRSVAPFWARATNSLALTGAFGLVEADSTLLHETRRWEGTDRRLHLFQLWVRWIDLWPHGSYLRLHKITMNDRQLFEKLKNNRKKFGYFRQTVPLTIGTNCKNVMLKPWKW